MAKREKKGKEQWDQLLDGIDCKGLTPEEVLGQEGRIKQLTGRVLQKILEAERDEHLGDKKHDHAGDNRGDSRNGHRAKTVLSENQELELNIPRDRQGTFEPPIIPKYQKRVPLFNDQILSRYSLGMTDRDIKSHREKRYNVEGSPDLISRETGAVQEEEKEWQNRRLEKSQAILYRDALRVHRRQEGKSGVKSRYVALAVNFEGKKEV